VKARMMRLPSSLLCLLLVWLGAVLWALGATTHAVAQTNTKGVYTCVDSKGRRLTSDRPIAECLDREQQQMGSSGAVRRVVPPSYTAEERARLDAQRKQAEQERARLADEKRRDRALLMRYPTQTAHDKARAEELALIDDVVNAAKLRDRALEQQGQAINNEMEFYQRDPTKAPAALRRQYTAYQQQVRSQQRFLDEQAMQKQRIHARFDEELTRLRLLWAAR
jgi:hypothetical protein